MPDARTSPAAAPAAETPAVNTTSGGSPFAGQLPIQDALVTMRLRLLDLTSRNRLLNFKHSPGKSLQLVHSAQDKVCARLLGNQGALVAVNPVPEPQREFWAQVNGRLTRPDVKEHAARCGINTDYELTPQSPLDGGAVRALYYPDELARHCRKLAREARSAIEETGANMLFLVHGFLEYPDREINDRILLAPLISVPVALEKTRVDRNSGQECFSLKYTGEDLADNLSLREKLLQEYGFELPEFDDEAGPEACFRELERRIERKPRWKVKRHMTVALLSFSKMLLVRDLDPARWPVVQDGSSTLMDHNIVRMVFEGAPRDEAGTTPAIAPEHVIDGHPLQNLPLIYDADSSQHSALIDALAGKNLVVEGPPGTGKSQTITNLIAAALAAGKSVLFVSEKLAALEVVQKRLVHAGLAHFCLELHSNKTQKKHVLEELQKRRDAQFLPPAGLAARLQTLEEKRQHLAAYADLLNGVHGNACGLTVHEVLWRAERFRQACGESWLATQEFYWPDAPLLEEASFRSLSDALARVAEQHHEIEVFGPEHPYWGLFVEELLPETDLHIERTLREFLPQFQDLAKAFDEATIFLGAGPLCASAETTTILLKVLAAIAPAHSQDVALEMLPRLFVATDREGLQSHDTLHRFGEKLTYVRGLRARVGNRLLAPGTIIATDSRRAEVVQTTLTTLGQQSGTTQQLQALQQELADALGVASTALHQLETIGTAVGYPFQGDAVSLRKVVAVIDVAAAAPRELLAYRHAGLGHPNTLSIIAHAQAEHQRLSEERSALDDVFYLDSVDGDAPISTAIGVLREGTTWYRMFQSRWRRACATHRTLDRSKTKKPAAARLAELERLQKFLRNTEEWRNSADYRTALGPFYSTDSPRFDEARRLAKWYSDGLKRLIEADLDPQRAGVLDGEETRLVRLGGLQAAVSTAVHALQQLQQIVETRLDRAQTLQRLWADVPRWQHRIASAQAAEQQLREAAAVLAAWAPMTLPALEVVSAVQARAALPGALADLDADTSARALLGDRFLSAETDMEPALAALTYGRSILQARLPVTMKKVLLSDAVVENYRILSRLLTEIQTGWAAVDQFTSRMATFGRFDLTAWAAEAMASESFVPSLVARTAAALTSRERLLPWVQYLQATTRARERGLGELIDLVEKGSLPATNLVSAFGYRFFGSIARAIFTTRPELARFAGATHEQARREYAALDREIIRLRGLECAHRAACARSPVSGRRSVTVGEKTELELLNHMVAHPRARVTLRRMLSQAGMSVQALKPCFMMGPQAVAQYLEPGTLTFDIVVMDEASQLKPEEAIGAIARGKQLIVVGDPKQLPPTSFFDKLGATADDGDDGTQAAAVDSESILDVCIGHFQPVRTLRWHYRSRHESLIAFSNSRFYDNRLIVFPSAYGKSKRLGVRYHYVSGAVYENQMNRQEAARVVDAALDHMLNRPEDSLGIVTLNLKQRDLLEEMLEQRCRNVPQSETFRNHWESEGMGLFVKNLESVQGDERDVIFISTTFGCAPNTAVVRQNFGPISRHTGWRRLNVLFTRARQSVHVFTSMRPEDIVVDEGTPRGTRALHEYLKFARSGVLVDVTPTGGKAESDFELAVTDVLHGAGYAVVPQLGVAGYRIDMAVKHPGYPSTYLAAIECDGATYHSGVSVRDRDRIRQEVLESLGWQGRIWRIWSADWFRSPDHETKRLLAFLQNLVGQPLADAYMDVEDEPESQEPRAIRERQEPVAAPGLALAALVGGTPVPVEPAPSQQSLQLAATTVVLEEDDDEDFEVEVGDAVTYAALSTPDQPITVRIVSRQTDFEHGIIAEATPLAQTLLGAVVGDEVVLRVPGKPAQPFTVTKIVRPGSE